MGQSALGKLVGCSLLVVATGVEWCPSGFDLRRRMEFVTVFFDATGFDDEPKSR